MDNPRLVKVEYGVLAGQRPRHAGSNARLGPHGLAIRVPILRITTEDGATGFGAYHGPPDRAADLLGQRFAEVFAADQGVRPAWRAFDYPLWDLAGQRTGQPVYALAAAIAGGAVPTTLRAPCYDTSLYFDDLHLTSDEEATDLIAAEAQEGYTRGHRAFKLKVGRGARHMSVEDGTRRDIAVIRAVRAAVGPEPPLMIDANNGYTLNLAKRVLAATADCRLFWLEEAFHEDAVLYQDLRDWLRNQGLTTLIADGEGQADPRLLDWAQAGIIDVVQYDIFSYGFTNWLALGQRLDAWGARSAPHHYGRHYGNYAAGHLAGAVQGFTYVEWDEATTPGLDASRYTVDDGWVSLPATPGFGLALDETEFRRAIARDGFTRTLPM